MSVRTVRVALGISAALACASPKPVVDTVGWHEVRVPGIVVQGDVSPENLRELTSELGLFQSLVKKVTNARIDPSSPPVRLYVFGSSEQAAFFTGPAAGVMIGSLSGYFAALGDDGFEFQTRDTLLHEYAHAVIQSGRRHAYPRWYEEGLCEFLAVSRFRDDAVIVGTTNSGRLHSLERWGPLPLEDLFGRDDYSGSDVYRFYATSWALVHHLNSSPEGRARLGAYVSRLVRGDDWRSAYAASFASPLASLEASLAEHIAKLQRGVRMDYHLSLESLPVPEDWSERAVPPAEVAHRLALLARYRAFLSGEEEDEALAGRLFARAVALDADDARARAGLSWVLAREGRWEASRAQLARAQASAPDDAVVALEAGRVAALRSAEPGAGEGEREVARTALEVAVSLGPERPEAYEALARFHAAVGEPRLAIPTFERARALGTWSPRLEVDLARQYLDLGQRERAAELLRPVAADAHGGRPAEEARELLAWLAAAGGHRSD